MSLTSGVINEILCTPDPENLPANPVVQVLGVKKLPAQSGGQERYRLVLSDGVHYYTSAMLGTQLNDRVGENLIEVKSVIRVTRYTCNVIQETRRIIIILDLEILHKASEMSGKIGEPVQMSDLVANHVGLKSAIKTEAKPTPISNNQPLRSNNPTTTANRPSPYASSNQSNTSSMQKSYSGGASATASGKNIFPIVSLTPYQNRWTIRARITAKSNIRTWSNSRGEGKLFSLDLVDESGEIRATGFNDVVDKYYETLEQGKVYYFTKGSLKTANKKFTTLKNDYEMSLNSDTLIEPCLEECDLPSVQYNFLAIRDIEQKNKDSVIDLIGVVKVTGDVTQITTKATNKQVSKRDITLVDQSKATIRATLWGQDAENFSEHDNRFPILAIKGAKVSDFGGRSLSIPSSSNFSVNPDIPEAHTLRGWYDNGGSEEQTSSLSGQGMGGDSMGGTYKTIAQIKEENLGAGEKADFFNVRASIVFLKKENCLYQACPGAECNKKVNEENGQYRCEKCDRTYPDFKYRLMLQSNIADHTGNQWITSFQDSAEVILGTKSDQLGRLREENENEFDKLFSDASFTPFILKIRAKHETYQDESKLKCVTVAANPIDYRRECTRLIGEIKQLASK